MSKQDVDKYRQKSKVMEARSRPPADDATSPLLSSALTTATQQPTYSSCFYSSSRDRSLVRYVPSGSGTIECVLPCQLDCSGSSVVSSLHQSSAIAPGSSTRLTCPPSSREVRPGCEDPELRRCVSESPPPSYETVTITARSRRVRFTVRDVTSRQGHDLSTVPSTSRPRPLMITSRDVTPTVPPAPRVAPPINHIPMSGTHRTIADRISPPTPRSTPAEQPGVANLEDTVHCGRINIDNDSKFVCYVFFSFLVFVIIVFLIGMTKP